MEPNRVGGLNFELPPQPSSPENQQGQERTTEAPPARPEQATKQPPQPALPAVPDDIPVADQPVIKPPQDVPAPIPTDPKAVANDADHIEREWVDKVKTIIARTHDDPHLQKEQMSRVKAEYIQKRFNKTIKTDEAAA
ncbi:hypothetical protein KW794_01805 [Candidatus Saccharibacteria bacterium]|nr:hypothetical protein [Candidatus Saccharibacteria bacterium]